MFWTAAKVLFLRQLYGFKHRWASIVLSVVMPVILIALLHIRRDGKVNPTGLSEISHPFKVMALAGISSPIEVVVTPHDTSSEQLMNDAYRILQFDLSNSSVSNLRLIFTASVKRMNQTLEKFDRPSIGVQFHQISHAQLEYTLVPGITAAYNIRRTFIPQLMTDAFQNVLLQLQLAIDTAYIRKHYPGHRGLQINFLDSPDFFSKDQGGEFAGMGPGADFITFLHFLSFAVNAGFASLSLMPIMSLLASYIIRDKLSGVRELLCINGVPRWMVSSSWLFTFCVLAIIIALIQMALLKLPSSEPLIPSINPLLLAVLLIVHIWSALIFSNFLANLLTSSLLISMLICIYWIVTSGASWGIAWGIKTYLVPQAFVSLIPNVGYSMFIAVLVFEFHSKGNDLSFGNLFSRPVPDEFISAGLILIMMLVSMHILLMLALYVDAVKPGPYGRARPWYLYSREKSATVRPADALPQDKALIQEIKADQPIGLKCVDIVKIFGTHRALNNVNLKIIKNSITILLGHNGAGKTTLFSILCGMFSPTSGDVYAEGYNIFKEGNIDKFRRVLGYCPQENLLLDELTVQEHLVIFGLLKGLSKSDALTYSDQWTNKFDMYSMRHTQVKKLSGGFKRKLCLAIAMTGDPKYLLLDEPSAGLDIESTRLFCDLILEEKGNCTVVITTHNLDEADILGDRIAILAHGKINCYGENSFLKRMLDTGYRLNCIVTSTSTQDVIQTVTSYMKGATVLFKMNHSVTFHLPSTMMQYIPSLLRRLEKQFGDSVSSALTPSTLDDVFIKVQRDLGVKINVEEFPTISRDEMNRSCCFFSELLKKRLNWILSRRMVTMILLVILLPCLAMIGDMFLLYSIISPVPNENKNVDNLAVPSKKQDKTFVIISKQRDNISDHVRSALKKSVISFKEISNSIMVNKAQKNLSEHQFRLPFDIKDSAKKIIYFFKTDDSMSAYSAVINALLEGNASIITHRPSFWETQNFNEVICITLRGLWQVLGTLFSGVISPFFLAASTYFLVFPHEERITLFKHLQFMAGLQPVNYWLMNLLFDMSIFASSFALLIIVIATMNLYMNLFFHPLIIAAFIVVFSLYGLSSIMFSYIWSFFFKSNTTPILIIFIISIVLSTIMQILTLEYPNYVSMKYVYFLPYVILSNSVANIVTWAVQKKICDQCNHSSSCLYVEEHPLFRKELIHELVGFGAIGVGYFLVVMFLDYGLGRRLLGLVLRYCYGRIEDVADTMDSEVVNEKQRVYDLDMLDEDNQPALVCDGLGKKYSCNKTAVYDVTFMAERGECFGLVGVNGSGKTTTFGMLAALLCVSKGNAVIEGRWSLGGCELNYMRRVGYCPQYSGLLKELSALTILTLFGRLRGVPRSQIESLVDQWITALDMADIARRPCGHYSGGNKRKLSLAMALIGCQPVALLDEPTAGVDPVVRRRIWKILTMSLEEHEQTVILTSHTMSECEAICNRLTIMVKGVMQCLGPIPQLKQQFGKSYILEVKFTPDSTIQQQNSVRSQIKNWFHDIEFEDTMLNRLKVILQTENLKMYDLFSAMLKIRANNSVIEDFNLSETPLEEVFLMFAQKR